MPNTDNDTETAALAAEASGSQTTVAGGSAIAASPSAQERDLREHGIQDRDTEDRDTEDREIKQRDIQQRDVRERENQRRTNDEGDAESEANAGYTPEHLRRPQSADAPFSGTREDDENEDPADRAVPQPTTTGAVNRDLKNEQASREQASEDGRAATLSTADSTARMQRDEADQGSMTGGAVRTRPQTTPMRPAPAPVTDLDTVLQPAASQQFRERWRAIQAAFVDDPRHAVEDADRLLRDVTNAFTSSLEERRRALTANRRAEGAGETEQLRLTMRQYRNLVDTMLHG